MFSIGIALAILIGAFLILGGFKNNIREKVYSFDSHIQVFDLDKKNNEASSIESSPISIDFNVYKNPNLIEGIKSINLYSSKVGMILENSEVYATVLKGITEDYDKSNFEKYITRGKFPNFVKNDTLKDILVSELLCKKLKLDTGKSIVISFLRFSEDSTRFVHKQRKFNVSGVFKTDLPEIDEKLIICDNNQIRWINKWDQDQVGGFEVVIDNVKDLDRIEREIYDNLGTQQLTTYSIKTKYEDIFNWLDMLNVNVKVLIFIVFAIACINIFSTLFILVMERTHTIGVMKAIGATDFQIFKVFWVKGTVLLMKGMIMGNLIGLGFCALQHFFQIIPLDPENYYMSSVPIDWNWPIVIGLNLFVYLFVNIVLVIPVLFITGVKPIKSIRFS